MKKEISFKNSTGQTLKGILHIPDKKYYLKFPAVIVCHGYTGSKDTEKYATIAEALSKADFVALRFDFAGSGESEGKFEDVTVTQEIEDARSAITALQKFGFVDTRIGIIGHSLGGSIAIFAAEQDSRILAVVSSCAPTYPEPTFRQNMSPKGFRQWHNSGYAVPWKDEKFKTKYSFWQDYEKYDLIKSAKKLKMPLLVLGALRDTLVAPYQTRALAKAANAPLQMFDAGHDYDDKTLKQVCEATINWFKRNLG